MKLNSLFPCMNIIFLLKSCFEYKYNKFGKCLLDILFDVRCDLRKVQMLLVIENRVPFYVCVMVCLSVVCN